MAKNLIWFELNYYINHNWELIFKSLILQLSCEMKNQYQFVKISYWIESEVCMIFFFLICNSYFVKIFDTIINLSKKKSLKKNLYSSELFKIKTV